MGWNGPADIGIRTGGERVRPVPPHGMAELKADALAMPAGRKTPALDHRHLVRHVGVSQIMGDGGDPRLRQYCPQPILLPMTILQNKANLSTIWETPLNLSAFRFSEGEFIRQFRCGSRPTT